MKKGEAVDGKGKTKDERRKKRNSINEAGKGKE